MNLSYINPYFIIAQLEKENEELKEKIKELETKYEHMEKSDLQQNEE